MSSIGNPSMYVRDVVKKLPAALMVALLALVLGSAVVFAQGPAIKLEKNPDPLAVLPVPPDTQEVIQGGTAKFRILVTNVGNIALQNIQVTDSCNVGPTRIAQSINADEILDIGEIWTYTCEVSNVQASFNNVASVRAVDAAQNPVSSQDGSAVKVLNPGIHMEKKPKYPTIPTVRDYFLQNEEVEFTVTIRNTGDFDINEADIAITDLICKTAIDPKAPISGDNNGDNVLGNNDPVGSPNPLTGEIWEYTCKVLGGANDVVNQASVTVKDVFGRPFSHQAAATAKVLRQGLAITKDASKSPVAIGETMKWTIKVYNTGATTFTGTSVGDAQCGAAPLAPVIKGNGDNDPDLEPGEIWTYECEKTYPVAGKVDNTATVDVVEIIGAPDRSASGTVEVVDPKWTFTVTPPIQYVMKGSNATLTYKVANTGSGAISDVQVANPQCAPLSAPTGDTNGNNMIDGNDPATPANESETWTYTCALPNLQQTLDTQGTFQGKIAGAVVPNPAPARADAKIIVINAGLNLKKELINPVIYGGQADFRITVTNSGNVEYYKNSTTNPLSYPVPLDPQCAASPVLVGLPLKPGDNDDAIDPGETWAYTCSKLNVTAEFENTATLSVKDPAGNVVDLTAKVTVKVLTPGLSLQKLPAYQLVTVGTFGSKDIEWSLRVHNTGPTNLTPVGMGVTDGQCNGGVPVRQPDAPGNNDMALNPGEVWVFKCTLTAYPWWAGSTIINDAYAQFTSGGNTLYTSATARAQIVGTEINLSKTANPPIILPGAPVKFTFEVGNPGFDDLTNVVLEDAMCPGGTPTRISGDVNGDNKLNVTEKWVYECTVSGQQNDYTNTATVTANGPSGTVQRSTATATVRVINAKIDVNKTASPASVNQGGTVNFTIEVKNTGTEPLKEVVAVDDKCTLSAAAGDTNSNGRLDTTETWTYTCAMANVQDSFRNSVTVTAKENTSNLVVTGSDFVDVTVTRPGINLIKTATQASVAQGGTAFFTIVVSNAGSTNLSNVAPVDAFCPLTPISLGNGNATLEVGETWVYTCAVPNVQGTNGTFVNIASVTANSSGIPVSAQDDASVTVVATPTPTPTPVTPTVTPTPVTPTPTPVPPTGKLKLQKSPATQTIVKGATATFQVTLNNGTVEDLSNVSLSDPQCTSLTRDSDAPGNNDGTLNTGETWRWTCTIANVQKSFTNKAKATAFRPSGKKVTASASAKVKVVKSNQLRIETSVTDAAVNPGASVPMRITVTNIGAGNLRDLQVSHDACTDAVVYVGGDANGNNVLNRGESWVYTCTIVNVQGEINGLATAAAIDDNNEIQEADAFSDVTILGSDESEEEAAAPTFKIFTPLIGR